MSTRSKIWQIGRKLKTFGSLFPSGKRGILFKTLLVILSWDNITPLGFPVVPDVYIMVANSSGFTLSFLASTSVCVLVSFPSSNNSE